MFKNRRAVLVLFVFSLILSLAACEPDDKKHERTLNEISEKNAERNEKRKRFLTSKVYEEAGSYVKDILSKIMKDCEIDMSLEPGNLIHSDLEEFKDFSENAETRKNFFEGCDLYIKVNFWDYEKAAEDIYNELISRGISCRLAADKFGRDIYRVNAVTEKVKFEPQAEA